MFADHHNLKNRILRYFCYPAIWLTVVMVFFCSDKQNYSNIKYKTSNDSVYFAHQQIALKILPSTQIMINFLKDGKTFSICSPENQATHYVMVDDQIVNEFTLIPGSLKHKSIESEYGNGQQISLLSLATGPKNCQIQKKIYISLFERYPDVAFVRAVYKNTSSDSTVTLNRVYSNMFTLDRKLVHKESLSFDFWTFFGYGKILGGGHNNVRVNVMQVENGLNVES